MLVNETAALKSVPVQLAKTHCPIAAPDATQRHCRSVGVGPQAAAAQATAQAGALVCPLIRKIMTAIVTQERSFILDDLVER